MTYSLVIGAGPAGLMAAEMLAGAGKRVIVAEAKPTAGRKLLMAGKSGLNLTRDEPFSAFLSHYGSAADALQPMLAEFGPAEVQTWARGLDQPLFTGSTGRVFPRAMKASPLLRAWLVRLAGQGVTLRTGWRWRGWRSNEVVFDTPDGTVMLAPETCVLALGGASWARLGSNGAWAGVLEQEGVKLAPFQPANMGFCVGWSAHMTRHFGKPVKGVALHVGSTVTRGEFVITKNGVEGGAIYNLSRQLREGGRLLLDLLPDWSIMKVEARLMRPRGKASVTNFLRKALRLDPVRFALLREFGGPLPEGPALAQKLKALPMTLLGPRPLDEAISTAGGVCFEAVTQRLELTARAGVFCAGEMLDWEAPTGGYLLTASLATGRWAGRAAAL